MNQIQSNTPVARRDRFTRLATNRTKNVLKALEILGNCSNRTNYNYQPNEVEKIFSTIENKLKEVRVRFQQKDKKIDFEL